MPRLTISIPKYRLHRASGQAVVTLNGRDFYLGKYNSQKQQRRVQPINCRVADERSPAPYLTTIEFTDHR